MDRQAKPKYAEPGDTIEITHRKYHTGKQFMVIKCPGNVESYPPGCAWHENPNKAPSFSRIENYKIVKRGGESVPTPSIACDTPVDAEKSFRQKRDELLRRAFGH